MLCSFTILFVSVRHYVRATGDELLSTPIDVRIKHSTNIRSLLRDATGDQGVKEEENHFRLLH